MHNQFSSVVVEDYGNNHTAGNNHAAGNNHTAGNDEPDHEKLRELNAAIEDVQNAEFVAMDFEFSGLYSYYRREHELETYFSSCASNAKRFSIMQLGVCAARRSKESPTSWLLSPYNFYCLPGRRTVFSSDTKTFQWLRENGFDFHEWLETGYDYMQLTLLQSYGSKARLPPSNAEVCGLQRIIETIIEHEIPLVLHNGLFDLLHICDKFIGDIPKPLNRFCSEVLRLFTGGVYDTKHIATQGLKKLFQLSEPRSTSLQDLRCCLLESQQINNSFRIADHRIAFVDGRKYSLKPDDLLTENSNAHEAGFDALATAQTFLMELEVLFRYAEDQKRLNDYLSPKTPPDISKIPRSLVNTASHHPDNSYSQCGIIRDIETNIVVDSNDSDRNFGLSKSSSEVTKLRLPLTTSDRPSTADFNLRNVDTASRPTCQLPIPNDTSAACPVTGFDIAAQSINTEPTTCESGDSDEESVSLRSPDSCKRRKISLRKAAAQAVTDAHNSVSSAFSTTDDNRRRNLIQEASTVQVQNKREKCNCTVDVDANNRMDIKDSKVEDDRITTCSRCGGSLKQQTLKANQKCKTNNKQRDIGDILEEGEEVEDLSYTSRIDTAKSYRNSKDYIVTDKYHTTGKNTTGKSSTGGHTTGNNIGSLINSDHDAKSIATSSDSITDTMNGFTKSRMNEHYAHTGRRASGDYVPFGWSKADRWWCQFRNRLGVPVFPGELNFASCAQRKWTPSTEH